MVVIKGRGVMGHWFGRVDVSWIIGSGRVGGVILFFLLSWGVVLCELFPLCQRRLVGAGVVSLAWGADIISLATANLFLVKAVAMSWGGHVGLGMASPY